MTTLLLGERIGGFILFTDGDGLRHAVRLTAVLALSDGDQAQDSTVMQLTGNRTLVIQMPLDEALGWFPGGLTQT